MNARDRFDSLIEWHAALHQVPWKLLKAQIAIESAFDPYAVSHVGAKGLAQFMDPTFAEYGAGDPFNPEESIKAQAKYMAWLIERTGGVRSALAAYNGGIGRLEQLGYDRMPTETKNYVFKIMQIYDGGT